MQWALAYHPSLYILAAVAAALLLYFARRSAISPNLRRLWFFIPRAIVLSLVLMILLNPVHESARQLPPTRPKVSCLIDSSRSMGLDRPTARIEGAKQIVFEAQRELDRENGAQLQLYRFGTRLGSVPSLAELHAEDDESRLAESLSTLSGIFHDPPEAVVVLSDGRIENANGLADVAKGFGNQQIPVHVFAIGDASIQGDIAIENLSVPRGAKPGDQVPIRVGIRSQGFAGQRVKLIVVPTADLDTKPLAELPITLAEGSQSHDIVVPANPNAGELTVLVPLQNDEAIESNNRVPFEVIARDRKINVFYMEGSIQGREYGYVQDALQEDPNIKCVSAIVDDQYVARPRITRIHDPYRGFPATRAELFEYDVVICSDISRGAFTKEQLDWTAELVRDRGGGFVMVGGYTSFGAGGWDQTVWDQLIPIDMRGGTIGSGFVNQQFRVRVPQDVRTHPIWRMSEDATENDRIIDAMPAFLGTNIAKRVKPAAKLLAVSATRLSVAGISPVFASQSYGRGRTFAMLPDTTEMWGTNFEKYWGENDNRHFRKFWRNVVNWLTENSVSAQRRLVVDTDKLIYRPGESIELSVQAYDEDYKPTTECRVSATVADGEVSATANGNLVVVGDGYEGSVQAKLPPLKADDEASTLTQMRLTVSATDGGDEIANQQVKVQVLNDSDELLNPNPSRDSLLMLAETTGGKVLETSDDLVTALTGLNSLPGQRIVYRTPIWDHTLLWLGILCLIVTEWIMRRRFAT